MSFGGFLDSNGSAGGIGGGGGGGGGTRIASDIPFSNNHSNHNMGYGGKSIFNSPGLSLALQTGMEGQGEVLPRISETFEVNGGRRSRDEEHDSRSGSDNLEGGSGDDLDATDRPPRKKRYHRHTPQQIQELESLFKECPHPDEKQRLELSRRLSLETRQVKFWFQNRRTQMKTQIERHENSILRQENDRLRAENMTIREAMRTPNCNNCGGGAAMIGDHSLEEQHLRIENARIKEELDRVCALAGKFIGRPISSMPGSLLSNSGSFNGLNPDFGVGINNSSLSIVSPNRVASQTTTGIDRSLERSMYLELALVAMDELVKMAQTDEPLWFKSLELGGRDVLNEEEYFRMFNPCIGLKPNGFVTEASRETGMVIINSLALVETLMDSNRWAEMFSCMISRAATTDVISSGMGGTRNGSLQLVHAELQVLSPLVPIREVNFLRFCKQHAENVWAVVDVSIDSIRDSSGAPTFVSCRRLPSGCLVQDMPNGYSKVTWIEHSEFDVSIIHQIYRPLICNGMGFGAPRWMATLQRQCECLTILMSTSMPTRDHTSAITAGGRRSMLKLAQRMTDNFCAGTCGSTVHKWNKVPMNNVDEDVRVMTRNSMDDPGEPPGIVLSAATSVWLSVSPTRLFDFLRDERLRSEWDILSNGGPMQEMAHIAKGQDPGNSVSLLRASAMNPDQSSMLILQETSVDAVGSLVVYAPVDIPAMHVVMKGGDSAYVALLPSGFSIVADGSGSRGRQVNGGSTGTGAGDGVNGSLLTVVFQILVTSLPNSKLNMESVETVNNLISCTVQRIKSALQCEN